MALKGMGESVPLKWPDGWTRTMPEHQESNNQWKKSRSFYVTALEVELKRIGSTAAVLTMNPSGDRDPGAAVWFSRTRKEDFSWREALRITDAYPSLERIDEAYRHLAGIYHPDKNTGDIAIFHKLNDAKKAAKDWVNRREGNIFDFALGADKFRDVRLNIAALANSIRHIRGLERCGTSAIMEKTLQGFAQLTEGNHV